VTERPLAIVSVFAPSERNRSWYALQKRFIAKTTDVEYDYKVILNGVSPDGFEPGDIAIANPQNLGHGEALMQAVGRFREQRRRTYLLLDSDCFPVRAGWHGILTSQMARFGKQLAAPVRTENLDVFPHPCAFFILDEILDDPRLELRRAVFAKNLLGVDVTDAGAAVLAIGDRLFPMLRTNAVNLHPVAVAVYSHLFYHHGAGSRDFAFRVNKKFGYYHHWPPEADTEALGDRLFQELETDPEGFIARLMGPADSLPARP
jgi:hypothetical protein